MLERFKVRREDKNGMFLRAVNEVVIFKANLPSIKREVELKFRFSYLLD